MANITKRTNRKAAEHLAPEQALVSLLCETKGALGVYAVPSVVATLASKRAMEKRAGRRLEAEGGLAAAFPRGSTAIAVTPTRVLVIPSNGLSFKAPAITVGRGQVTAEVVGAKGLGRRMTLTFEDGTTVEVDVPRAQPLEEFLALLVPA